MTKLFSVVMMSIAFSVSAMAEETVTVHCVPVPNLNMATIQGTLKIAAAEPGSDAVVEGVLDMTLQRIGKLHQPREIKGVAVKGVLVETPALPDSEGNPVVRKTIKLRGQDVALDGIQYINLSMNGPTLGVDSWVLETNLVKYFANCTAN